MYSMPHQQMLKHQIQDSNKIAPTDQESFCNNCHNMPDDLEMEIPPPIHKPILIREFPSPWLHYGFCEAFLEFARFRSSEMGQGNEIIEHIAQCPGRHEEHIHLYTEKENKIALKSSNYLYTHTRLSCTVSSSGNQLIIMQPLTAYTQSTFHHLDLSNREK